tara:strand:+ start:18182 stop:18391 length:210 start_codon:yes stop_codon:yes gene_type:complete
MLRIGDLVRYENHTAVVLEIYQSKCWRTDVFGSSISWGNIDPEPFARILVDGILRGVPQTDLELIGEGR